MLTPLCICNNQPIDLVGAKALHLARSMASGQNVPEGWVIPSTDFRSYIRALNGAGGITSSLKGINEPHPDLNRISSEIQAQFGNGIFPLALGGEIGHLPEGGYAVRSSAAFEDGLKMSWAGQFDSFLNVQKNALIEAVIRCWASCFSARALSYGADQYKHPEEILFAVIIQRMMTPDYAGVAFSRHPVKGTLRTFIELVRGSGAALVSGKAADYTAEVDHETGRVSIEPDKGDGDLNREQILAVDRMVRTLEQEKGWPVDVEFGIDKQGIKLLQVRPLTVQTIGVDQSLPHLKDYEMTFKVNGISLLFGSILTKAFGELDPLFTSDQQGRFKQYFTKEKMFWAAQRGFDFFSDERAFDEYIAEFRHKHEESGGVINAFFAKHQPNREAILVFGDHLASLFAFYSRTDNQYTNEAYAKRDENPTLASNLKKLAAFKDVAREWINALFLPDDAPLNRFIRLMQEKYDCSASSVENRTLQELADDNCMRSYSETQADPYVIWAVGGITNLITGSQTQETLDLIVGDDDFDPNVTALRGAIANGFSEVIRGSARVIEVDYANVATMQAAIDRMEVGEILIAEFTAPELLLACKKAKAIVTDIGGLLSHAAIVSRELNVPCLVGTKHSSKLFKTGDPVQIDLKLGIISKVA